MKKLYRLAALLLVFMISLSSTVMAGQSDDEDYDWKTWKTRRSMAGFNGHGGFFFIMLPFRSSDLDFVAEGMELDHLPELMHGMGGLGMGHIGSGWRIGGGGFGTMARTKDIFQDSTGSYNRELEIMFGGGGLIVEHSPWMIKRVNFGCGALIGFGSINIRLRQDSGAYEWSDVYEQYCGSPADHPGYNIVSELDLPLFLFQPYATARLHLIDWLALEGAVGLNLCAPLSSAWNFKNHEISGGGPEVELNRPIYRIGLVFGG